MNWYLGTQGWGYKDWVGTFYPPATQPRDFLRLYADQFSAVELDTTFYATPRLQAVKAWEQVTPADFRFSAKVPRAITHERRLIDAGAEMLEFLRVIDHLGEKLGPLLIQLPPDFTADNSETLEAFVSSLPEEFRYAVEFRHHSWLTRETADLLAARRIAWTNVDLWYMPRHVQITTDFTYVRWLGNRREITRMNEVQIDRHSALDAWVEQLERHTQDVQRVYGFANNHYSGHSPADVRYLQDRLGLPRTPAPSPPLNQGTLL